MAETSGSYEAYLPRPVSCHGVWSIAPLLVKAYGIAAEEQVIDDAMIETAHVFLKDEVSQDAVDTEASNDLGFVILHPGSLGLSISAHWWSQGSGLCQRFYRKLYGAKEPLNMATRPSIGCVWELTIIQAELAIWKDTMMGVRPDAAAYLSQFADLDAA